MTSKHFPGYEISRDGRVYSVATNWRGYGRREMQRTPNDDGYPSVRILVNGKRKRLAVHVLVAMEYLPPRPSSRHELRHLDGDKLNSHVDNLAWGTALENAADRERHGRTSRGANHSRRIKESGHAVAVREFHRKRATRTEPSPTGDRHEPSGSTPAG